MTAITAANSGDTINIEAGTYATTVIDKTLTIIGVGAGSTIIVPTANTGNGGDGQAWILITTGGTLNLSNMTIDGSGFSIYRAMIFNDGSGSINSITMQNILHTSQYLGLGISVQGTSSASVTNSTFNNIGRIGVHFRGPGVTGTYSGNTYTGKGAGDFLDYGVEFGSGAVGTAVTVTGNTFENNSYGVVGGYDAADTSVVNATNNCFINNGLGFGSSGAAGMTLNATDNWWNSATGPVVDGPNGVSPDVVYTPFLTTAPAFCGGSVAPNAGDFPNIGMVKISVEQAQPAYDSAGGSIIRHNGGQELWLPHDYDMNGFDTYVVTETMTVDGRIWVGMWLGTQSYGWVPLDMVTIIYDPS